MNSSLGQITTSTYTDSGFHPAHWNLCPCGCGGQRWRSIEEEIDRKMQRAMEEMQYRFQEQMRSLYYYPVNLQIMSSYKEKKEMNIVTYAKLNKDQRTLYKAGVVDTDGHLTSNGRDVLLDMLAADSEIQGKLVAIAKEYKKDQKED